MTHSRLSVIVSVASAVSIALAASTARATPRHLRDAALGAITAGNANVAAATANGGAIVAANSSANVIVSGTVTDRNSQNSARAINLVDATGSAIADGVNVWDGNSTAQNTGLTVNQTNTVLQTGTQSAQLTSYVRSKPNVSTTLSTSNSTSNQGSVNTKQNVAGQSVQGGLGVSAAGTINADLTGGTIHFKNNVSAGLTVSGQISVGGNIFGSGGSASTTTNANVNTTQTLAWVLPDLSLHVSGVGCYVDLGSCTADGHFDSSTQKTLVSQAPITMSGANAKYIVVDGSKLTANDTYGVALSDGAENDAKAINIVNASGSSVSDGVNVAYTTGTTPGLTLNQVNTVVQYR